MIEASAIRIMIVDDKSMMRTLTRRSLERIGFTQIFEAANPVEALPIARANRVHLVISDYNMPMMNGIEFIETIRQDPLLAKIGFIMLSGSGDSDVVKKAEELGASSYIMKPFSLVDLKDRLEDLFGKLVGSKVSLRIAA
jgi:two-component system, chemotaxis family, chemotaxis protein CheY